MILKWAKHTALWGITSIFLGMIYVPMSYASIDVRDSVKIGMRLEPPHLDPTAGSAASIDEIVYNNVLEGLTTLNAQGVPVKLLASSIKMSANSKAYIFTLKKGVFFHNGEPFTADSVVFSFKRILDKDSTNPRTSLYKNILSVKALSKHKVKFVLKNRDTDFLYKIGLPDAVIVGATSYKTNKTNPIGTGPFVFNGAKKGYYVRLKLNEKYYGTKPKLETVEFKFYSNTTSATAALLSGGVDAFPIYGDSLSAGVLKATKKLSVVIGSTEGETLVALNNSHPKLKDIRVRRALSHAINKDEIIAIVLQGNGLKIGSHFPPHHKDYIDMSNRYPYDIEKAKSFLKSAGAENLALEFSVPPSYELLAEAVSAQLRKSGVTVTIKKMDWGTWLATVFKAKKYDITVVSHVEPQDYTIYAKKDYYFAYNGDKIRNLMASLATVKNGNNKTIILQDIQRKLSNDAVNVWLYQSPKIGVWNKKLKGLWHNAPVEGNILRQVYWDK